MDNHFTATRVSYYFLRTNLGISLRIMVGTCFSCIRHFDIPTTIRIWNYMASIVIRHDLMSILLFASSL